MSALKKEHASHKLIEKKRRDRINACLQELSQTVPTAFSKHSSGKLEKAEILEMTVEYLRLIQASDLSHLNRNGHHHSDRWMENYQHYQAGYNECIREILQFMTNVEGISLADERCRRILKHLQNKTCIRNSELFEHNHLKVNTGIPKTSVEDATDRYQNNRFNMHISSPLSHIQTQQTYQNIRRPSSPTPHVHGETSTGHLMSSHVWSSLKLRSSPGMHFHI